MNAPSSSWLAYLQTTGMDLARGLVQLLYPNACAVCDVPLAADRPSLCDACRAGLLLDPLSSCQRCAATVGPNLDTTGGCLFCRNESFLFERVLRLGSYKENQLLRQVILRMKHLTGEMLADPLGELLAARLTLHLAELRPDVVVPVPLYWWRRWRRGYNQSEAVARRVAACLQLPCRPSWLRRVRHTPSQRGQTPAERRQNLKGAFRARPRAALAGRCVLLIDDVLTTGSTASEAAQSLRAAGAARVVVAVLGRSA